MCGIDRWDENKDIHTLIIYFFRPQSGNKFDPWTSPYSNFTLPHTLTHLCIMTDFMLTNKERLIWDRKARGSLDCSDHEVVECRILREGSRAKSRITAWTSGFLQVYQQQKEDYGKCRAGEWGMGRGEKGTVLNALFTSPFAGKTCLQESQRDNFQLSLKGHGNQGDSCGLEKGKCHCCLQQGQEGGTEELQPSEPHFSPWESDGANNPGNHCQTYEGLGGD